MVESRPVGINRFVAGSSPFSREATHFRAPALRSARLHDSPAGGAQVGATLCADNVSVIDGLFTVPLDFGPQFAGQERFLEIEVRADTGLDCANLVGFIVLSPLQPLTAAPNAIFAMNADQLDGLNSTAFLKSIPLPLMLIGTSGTYIIRGENTGTTHFSSEVSGRASGAPHARVVKHRLIVDDEKMVELQIELRHQNADAMDVRRNLSDPGHAWSLYSAILGFRFHDGIRLELNQPVRIDEPRHLHDGVGRTNRAEKLAMHRGHGLPILNPDQQGPCPNDLLK